MYWKKRLIIHTLTPILSHDILLNMPLKKVTHTATFLELIDALWAEFSSARLGSAKLPRFASVLFHAPAPNVLWVSNFTYVAIWQGFVHVAFVIDVFARHIVGWRVNRSATADFVLDALEQAIHQRRPAQNQLVHYSDRGSQYLSIKYTERLAEAKITPPAEAEANFYAAMERSEMAAHLRQISPRQTRRGLSLKIGEHLNCQPAMMSHFIRPITMLRRGDIQGERREGCFPRFDRCD